ncbi:MAG: hypothetical protein HC910_04985 [Spirulinaceae cyanobacterium SM2_1_0]|nr:hypothetical protein [Spirulinaceae cyanobacterium SM2_1_0]
MSQFPQPDGDRQRSDRPRRPERRRSRWLWLLLSIGLLAGGSLITTWVLLSRFLQPTVQAALTDTLDRPVELGEFAGFSLNSVRFDETRIPTTTTDPDFASIRAIEARFDLWQLLRRRVLVLDITLVAPDAYIEQDADGQLIELPTLVERDGVQRVEVMVLRVENASATLRLRQLDGSLAKPILLAETSGRLELNDRYESFAIDLTGQLAEGDFSLRGAAQYPERDLDALVGQFALTASDWRLAELSALIPPLPLRLQAGVVGGNVQIELAGNPLDWRVNTPRITGIVQVSDVQATVDKVPRPVRVGRGRIRLQGDRARLENVSAEVGELSAQLAGQVSVENGYDLDLEIAPVTLSELFDTFELEPPAIPLSGAVAMAAEISGDLEEPILTGNLSNVCATNRAGRQRRDAAEPCPLRVDRLDFDTVAADFSLRLGAREFEVSRFLALPNLGGTITASGQLDLDSLVANVDARVFGIPGAALAQRYQLDLPTDVGEIAARAQLAVALDNPTDFRATVSSDLEVAGGQVSIDGLEVTADQFAGTAQVTGLAAANFGLPERLAIQGLTGNFTASGPLTLPASDGLALAGRVQLALGGGAVTIDQLRLADQRLTATVIASGIAVSDFIPTGVTVPPLGRLDGRLQVTSQLDGFVPQTLQAVGDLGVNVAGGRARLTQLDLDRTGQLTAETQVNGLQLSQLAALATLPPALRLNRQALGQLTGAARLTTRWAELRNPNAIALQGRGNVSNLAGGTLAATFNARAGNWQAEARLAGVQPSRLTPQLPPAWQTVASGNLQLSGALDDLSLTGIRATGQGNLNLAGGVIAANNLRLANGQLSARLQPNGVQLAALSPALRGQLSGNIRASADLTQPSAAAVQADGNVRLSEGLSAIRQPLTADFAWNGSRLAIAQATAGQQFQASGYADLNLAAFGRGAVPDLVEQFNFDATVRNLAIAPLRNDLARFTTLPLVTDSLAVGGSADFSGNVAGTWRSPRIQGNLALNNLALNDLTFDPRLAGPVAFAPGEGARVDLQGTEDRLQLALDSRYRPVSLNVQLGAASITGERESANVFVAEARDLRLDLVRPLLPPDALTPTLRAQPLAGNLNGNFSLDLTTLGLAGTVAIAQPVIGPLTGERFAGGIEYQNGAIAIRDGQWRDGVTEYQIAARIIPFGSQPRFDAQVDVIQGQVQDLLAALSLTDIPDLRDLLRDFQQPATGSTTDLDTLAVGLPDAPLEDQLRRLAEIQALNEQQAQARRDAIPLPELSEARGDFNGTVAIGGPLDQGVNAIEAQFNLAGENWQWGSYFADTMVARGDFENGILTILPIRFRTGEGEIALGGSFGTESISGQLEITALPIEVLQDIIPLPPFIGLAGEIEASVTLAGTQVNPQARGTIAIEDAELNDTPIAIAEGSFNYNNAVLRFAADSVLVDGGTPLTLRGRIPYRLPLPQAAPPESNEFQIVAQAKDDGLAIANFFTNRYLTWEAGQGEADIAVSGVIAPERGDFESLIANGVINIEQATLGSRVVAETVTDVTGQILLNFDRIEVPELTGRFGGGDVRLAGVLPTQQPEVVVEPLTLELDPLALSLKGLMEGEVAGTVTVAGTALDPKLTGAIDVENGSLQLGGAVGQRRLLRGGDRNNFVQRWVEFADLRLVLGRNFFITQAGILSLEADGTLTLNGDLESLAPEGTIQLERGLLNLFTTQLRLDGSFDNIARFTPANGFDPFLNLTLVGSVTDATNRTVPISVGSQSSEILDDPSTLGSVETVRVQAKVDALASELIATLNANAAGIPGQRQQVLELSSTPSRSETEIIALLGGSFVNAIVGGDDTALVGGIANIAGNALFGRFQNNIADAIGLDEFRIFPAVVLDEEDRRGSTSRLGIAVEVSKNITNNFSLSVQQYLTPPDQPTRFSARYRINENLILRGSTDIEGDGRASIEFQTRF